MSGTTSLTPGLPVPVAENEGLDAPDVRRDRTTYARSGPAVNRWADAVPQTIVVGKRLRERQRSAGSHIEHHASFDGRPIGQADFGHDVRLILDKYQRN